MVARAIARPGSGLNDVIIMLRIGWVTGADLQHQLGERVLSVTRIDQRTHFDVMKGSRSGSAWPLKPFYLVICLDALA